MKRALAAAIVGASMIASLAAAQWKIETLKELTSDHPVAYATHPAKTPDGGVAAELEISCVDGQKVFLIQLSAPISPGRIGANLRVDEVEVPTLTTLEVLPNLRRIPIRTEPPFDLSGRHRFRIQLFPTDNPQLSFDFDLAGIDKAIGSLACKS